jgi:hypothetical protein
MKILPAFLGAAAIALLEQASAQAANLTVVKVGAPSGNRTAYLYRVDLRQGAGFTECVAGLVINFGGRSSN